MFLLFIYFTVNYLNIDILIILNYFLFIQNGNVQCFIYYRIIIVFDKLFMFYIYILKYFLIVSSKLIIMIILKIIICICYVKLYH